MLAKANGEVKRFHSAGEKTVSTLKREKADISGRNEAIEAQRERVREERIREYSEYMSEMGALSLWAVQHRSVRDTNNALLDDMAKPPTRAELTPQAMAQIEDSKKAVAEAKADIQSALSKMDDTASSVAEGLRKAAVQMGTTPDSVAPICARLKSEVGKFHAQLLEPQVKTLESMEGMLASVAVERLPQVVKATKKAANAAKLSVQSALAAFQRFANRVAQETLTSLEEEVAKKRRAMQMAAQL